jgi:hypothetical protein
MPLTSGASSPNYSAAQIPTAPKRAKFADPTVVVPDVVLDDTDGPDQINSLKEQVRSVASQNLPNESLLLLLDQLARKAAKSNDKSAQTYNELYRQGKVNQGKLNLPAFCLEILGSGTADVVSKALAKHLKKSKTREDTSDEEEPSPKKKRKPSRPSSPLQNAYPARPTPPNQPYDYNQQYYDQYPQYNAPPRGRQYREGRGRGAGPLR